MARIHAIDGLAPRAVEGPWFLATTPSGACAEPGDLDGVDGWIPAPVFQVDPECLHRVDQEPFTGHQRLMLVGGVGANPRGPVRALHNGEIVPIVDFHGTGAT